MSIRTVLISGPGIGGPTLAYWLHRGGYQVTVIERAPRLRDWGSAVDIRGRQMDILVRTGILDEVRAHQTGVGEQLAVDERDRPLAARRRAARSVRPAGRAVASRATIARCRTTIPVRLEPSSRTPGQTR